MARALTVKSIDAVKPGASRKEIPDGLVQGLYLVVQPSGAMSWAVRCRIGGAPRKITLGGYPGISLADARKLTGQTLLAVAEGRDPVAEKRAARREEVAAKEEDVECVFETYIERYAKVHTRPNSVTGTCHYFRKFVLPAWRGRRVGDIKRRDVLALYDEILDQGLATTANRTHSALSHFFNWCVQRDLLEVSPMMGVKKPSPEKSRDRVLSDDELRRVLAAADAEGGVFGPLVRVLALTGQRLGEVAGMRWDEIDFDRAAWGLPADRVKNGTAHEIPLAKTVLSLIRSLPVVTFSEGEGRRRSVPKDSDYVFTTIGAGPVSGFGRLKRRLDEVVFASMKAEAEAGGRDPADVKPIPHWTFHDLRRTFASGLAALGVSVTVTEKCLNHRSGTLAGVAGVYNRHSYATEMRTAVEAWARQVERIEAGVVESNVVEMRGRRDGSE